MVKMGVDVVELPAAGLVLHQRPGRGTEAGRVPTFRRLLRCLGEPESPPFDQLDGLLVVEDGHNLALLPTVLTAYADSFVARAVLLKVLELEIKSFLKTEYVRLLIHDHHRRGRVAVLPGIGAVVGLADPYVVGDHIDVSRLAALRRSVERQRQQCCHKDKKHSFHNNICLIINS